MDPTKKTQLTYDQIYTDYATRNKNPGSNIVALRRIFKNLLPKNEPIHLLDAGCANGRDVGYFLKQGYEVTGIDLCEPFLKLAKLEYPQVKFLKMDLRNLTFKDSSFNAIWAMASLLHIPKQELPSTLQGFYRVLKPNGIFLVSVMEGSFDSLRENAKLNWPARHFSDYQRDELRTLLEQAGFKVLRLSLKPTSWGPLWLNFFCTRI